MGSWWSRCAATPSDAEMVSLIAEQYPGRETIALDVGAILAYGGGGIHCITQQVPPAVRSETGPIRPIPTTERLEVG